MELPLNNIDLHEITKLSPNINFHHSSLALENHALLLRLEFQEEFNFAGLRAKLAKTKQQGKASARESANPFRRAAGALRGVSGG